MKPTAERILDAAEDLFAEKGYEAASLGEVADKVGIRSPSLYNHFKNKEALYLAVLDRLLDIFNKPLTELLAQEPSRENILDWQAKLTKLHIRHPNMARLLQHAALSNSPHTREFLERLFQPLFEGVRSSQSDNTMILQERRDLMPWAIMGFNNIIMGYVTMAPLYKDMLGVDPFSEESSNKQVEFIATLINVVWEQTSKKSVENAEQ